ncbi:MAG: hypothetical protein ACR2O1_07540 [Boseongicola sp.]
MKYAKPATAMAACITLVSSQVSAGGLAEPMMEPEVIEESSTASSGFIFPLLLLAIIAAVASSSGSSAPVEAPG